MCGDSRLSHFVAPTLFLWQKLLPGDVSSTGLEMRRNRFRPQTSLGSLQRSPRLPSWWGGGLTPLPKNPNPPRPYGPRCLVPKHPKIIPIVTASRCVLHKRINRPRRCLLASGLNGLKEPRIREMCTLAPPGEYKWTIRARRRCGFMPNYFDHLLYIGWPWRNFDRYLCQLTGFIANSKYKIQALFKDPNCIFQAPKLSTIAIS